MQSFISTADVEFVHNLFDTNAFTEKRKELEVTIVNPHSHPVKWLHNGDQIESGARYFQHFVLPEIFIVSRHRH